MKYNHAGRFTIIGLVLAVALVGIFVRGLKPGIDIAGGTALLYEIKAAPGSRADLMEQVAKILKKRVDPEGVKNLVWRPQGNRLEIQMPASPVSKEAEAARRDWIAAQERMQQVNVRVPEVKNVLTWPTQRRDAELKRMAGESKWLANLFAELSKIQDRYNEAAAKGTPEANALIVNELEPARDKLLGQIDEVSISRQQLESRLRADATLIAKAQKQNDKAAVAKRLAERNKWIDEQIAKAPQFAVRNDAIRQFVKAYDEFVKYQDSLEGAEDLKRLLRGSGVLEFHIAVTNLQSADAQAMVKRLQDKGPAVAPGESTNMRWYEVDRPDQLSGHQLFEWPAKSGKEWILLSTKPEDSLIHRENAPEWGLQRAYSQTDTRTGQQVVGFEFDAQGAKMFGDLTGRHIKDPLAIVLDDKVISAPNIQSRIEGSGIITGDRTEKDRQYLVSTLSAGSLPAKLAEEPISERTIGPAVGADNLRKGFIACVVGMLAVIAFMAFYYHVSGLIASLAVVLNVVLMLGVLAMFDATWTLPGIAAIVLTVGMAVDANVLIYERLREETARGLTLRMALHNAYERAFSAIVDSNLTTIITSLVLYMLGSEEIKGFGLTLIVGILASMFTALFVTRAIFNLLIDKFGLNRLGSLPQMFPRWQQFIHPKVDWIGKARYFWGFSIVFIAVGLIAFFNKGRQVFDIEFVSGTSIQFNLTNPMERGQVQKLVDNANDKALSGAQIVTSGIDQKSYELVTPNADAPVVKKSLMAILGDRLAIERPSFFAPLKPDASPEELAKVTVEQAIDAHAVLPVIDANRNEIVAAGASPDRFESNKGAVAIVLHDLAPKLSRNEIRQRINRAVLQPDRKNAPARRIEVETSALPDQPTGSAVVFVADEVINQLTTPERWQDELARPSWRLVVDAVSAPAEFQTVTSFNAQVASETMIDALVALTVATLLIMIYIWFRFGQVTYAAGVVVALLHDAIFTIAAVGLAHWVAATTIGDALLIEPFLVGLTMVAAVLTVIGYSINDTIVVFDRIRENRGKFGHLSPQLLNDAVNQTLSRTILTSFTTFLTVLIMYVFVPSGSVHAFTFAMLVGIFTGSYSSIAIAAPILLLGRARAAAGAATPVRVQRVGQ